MAVTAPNILVVEDDRETRSLIAKYLRSNACHVTTANDGREMVRAMADHRVDLLIPLLDLTQGRNAGSFERSIDVLVSRIRRKIETELQEAAMIKTVRSGGYIFTPEVEAVTSAPNGYP